MKKIVFHAGLPLGDGYNGAVSFRGDGDTKELEDEVADALLAKFPKPKPGDRREFFFSELSPPPPPPPAPPKAKPAPKQARTARGARGRRTTSSKK